MSSVVEEVPAPIRRRKLPLFGVDWPALVTAAFALAVLAWSVFELEHAATGIAERSLSFGSTPAILFAPEDPSAIRGTVVVAHGFAGSQPLMRSIALTLAGNGYRAITFDFVGHGRNPETLTGALMQETGAARNLLLQLETVIAEARNLDPTRPILLLGHSMASDVVIRAGKRDPSIAAVAAISMFSDQVETAAPRNLLIVSGEWEGFLRDQARRHLPERGVEGQTYGAHSDGTARRAVVGPAVEHLGILYSETALVEIVDWYDQSLNLPMRDGVDARNLGPAVLLAVAAIVSLMFPLSRLLPRLVRPAAERKALPKRRLLLALGVPTILTPLVLWPVPTDVLDVMVADYLALHFALFGLLLYGTVTRLYPEGAPGPAVTRRLLALIVVFTGFAVTAFGSAIHAYGANFALTGERWLVFAAILVGTFSFCLAEEHIIRRQGASGWRYLFTKGAFLLSLFGAIALDLQSLFFLIIILPVMVVIFTIHTLYSHWLGSRSGSTLLPATLNAVTYAWALAATFPILSGA